MSPGDISDLTLNDVVAFRARFEGDPPPPPLRYWRGPVLIGVRRLHLVARRRAVDSSSRRCVRSARRSTTRSRWSRPGSRCCSRSTWSRAGRRASRGQSWDYQPAHAQSGQRRAALRRALLSALPRRREILSHALRNASLQLPPGRNPRTLGARAQHARERRQRSTPTSRPCSTCSASRISTTR